MPSQKGTPPGPRFGHSSSPTSASTKELIFFGGRGAGNKHYNDVHVLDIGKTRVFWVASKLIFESQKRMFGNGSRLQKIRLNRGLAIPLISSIMEKWYSMEDKQNINTLMGYTHWTMVSWLTLKNDAISWPSFPTQKQKLGQKKRKLAIFRLHEAAIAQSRGTITFLFLEDLMGENTSTISIAST